MMCHQFGIVSLGFFVAAALPALLGGPAGPAGERGPYARIAFLRPHDGQTVEFEAGYIRHLDWHRQAQDSFAWYGWSIWAGERQRWFVYATFGHAAGDFDHAVAPAEDERDNVMNVVPHAEFAGNAIYEYLPPLSRGSGEPTPTARLELTVVDLLPTAAKSFEDSLAALRPALAGETLWYRMVAGGPVPRYVRLRPRVGLAAVLERTNESPLPESAHRSVAKMTVEILTLRPTMSLGLDRPAGD
ncbi:MAG TPA: hypothetical protein VKE50_02415 [Thermoanaerobaculia bacterium]|nr:hypothetical protein [Thermoanaerobaculia bacterium]